MTDAATVRAVEREIGTWDCGRPGPTLLVLGGIHGNESAGVHAAKRVIAALHGSEPNMRGRFVALAGNLQALERRQRFLSRDLNRGWGSTVTASLVASVVSELAFEDLEQRQLLDRFHEIERTASGPILFLDLHTSSAGGSPFICLADTIDNRRVALATGVPIILGIEETIEGASLEWFAERGIAGFAVEGGQHESVEAVDNLEAVLWLMLSRLGMLTSVDVDLDAHRSKLAAAVGQAPAIVEIVHRHVITAQDRFVMQPGYANFDRVRRGQLLATANVGEIRASFDCLLLLPLYQALGDDGFFLARRVRTFWLWLARWVRAMGVGRLLPLLPGIRRDPGDSNTLLANPKVARWFVVEVFHLLGYRRARKRGDRLAFSRRASRAENSRL